MIGKRYKVSLDDALDALHQTLSDPLCEWLKVDEAHGRRLSMPVRAPHPVPPQPMALRDGLALVGEGTQPILTGEAMPSGSRGLVKSERVGQADVTPDPRHIRAPGADVAEGTVLFEAGTWLDAWKLAALRAAGVEALPVWSRPRVALRAPEGGLGQKFLGERLKEWGADVGDDRPQLIVVSAGDAPGAYGRLVAQYDSFPFEIWKVALRPGKHVAIGSQDGVPLVLLPDHLVATQISWLLLLEPAIRRLSGLSPRKPRLARVPHQAGEAGVIRVLWAVQQGDEWLPLPDQAGQNPLAYRQADALLLVPPQGGDRVPLIPVSTAKCPEFSVDLDSP